MLKKNVLLFFAVLLVGVYTQATIVDFPSGLKVDNGKYEIDKAQLEVYDTFFQKTKAAYLESPDESGAMGSVYAGVIQLRESQPDLFKVLSEHEIAAIVSYSEWDYQTINDYLRSKKSDEMDDDSKKMAEAKALALLSALLKLPKHEGKVFRGEFSARNPSGLKDAAKRYSRIPEKGSYTLPGFPSTTIGLGEDATTTYITPSCLVYIIEGKTGRRIDSISTRPNEEEVLFPAFTAFEVVKKEVVKTEPSQASLYCRYTSEVPKRRLLG
jgi:hypothetical protein